MLMDEELRKQEKAQAAKTPKTLMTSKFAQQQERGRVGTVTHIARLDECSDYRS